VHILVAIGLANQEGPLSERSNRSIEPTMVAGLDSVSRAIKAGIVDTVDFSVSDWIWEENEGRIMNEIQSRFF
jgi:hypothetical protein